MNMNMPVWIRKPAVMIRIALAACLGLSVSARAANWYVSAGGDGTAGTSWASAFTNVQAAINAAVSNDTICLAGQTFRLTNQIDWTTSGITIRGGYEAAETDPAKLPGTNNPALWPTVIARLSGITRLIYINGANKSTLEHVSVTGGNADTGNGLRINNSLNVRLSGCSVTNNVSTGSGTAGRGGGIYAFASGLTLTNCVVIGNRVSLSTSSSSSVYGGGIYSEGGSLTLYDSKILNNDATCWFNYRGDGGGVYCSGTVKLKNVLLAGNLANRYGGGICVIGGTASLENCTIADNLETGIQRTGGTVSLINSIVRGHPTDLVGTSITVSYSALGLAGYDGVNGNIGADPLFEYGYHLAAGSPCIGKGSDSAGNLGLTAYTTRTDGAPYASGNTTVTMGYHQMPGSVFDLTYADVYVSLAGVDSNGGTLVTTPFRTMTKALAVARDGTRVHVATGRYERAVGVTVGEAFPLLLENRVGVQIIGTDAAQTVFDARGSGARVMDLICAQRFEMSGVTVTGGSVAYGAGLRVDRCLGVSLSDVTIADNVYYSNSGGAGGGIWAQSSAMFLADCTVRSNSVTAWTTASSRAFGGGVWFRYGRLTMRNCSILGNTATNRPPGWAYGGGVHRDGNAVLDLRNVLFAGNSVAGAPTADHGSGLYTAAGGSVLMENCTVTANTLGGIRCDGSPFTLLNSIVWGNGTYDLSGTFTSVRFSDVGTAGYAGVNDNISANPTFKDTAKGDYRLLPGSPAVNKGQSQTWMDDAVDLDGNSRISMAGVDIGCYELPAPAGTVILIR